MLVSVRLQTVNNARPGGGAGNVLDKHAQSFSVSLAKIDGVRQRVNSLRHIQFEIVRNFDQRIVDPEVQPRGVIQT